MTSKIVTLIAIGVVVFVDVTMELGVAVGTLYVLVLALAWSSGERSFVLATALVSALLIVAGFLMSPAGGEIWKVIFNRGLSLALIGTTTGVLWHEMSLKKQFLEQSAKVRQLASIVTFSEEAIFSGTLEGEILSWNQGAEILFGYSAEEMIGQKVHKLIPPHLQSEYRLALDRLLKGKALVGMEVTRIRKDDSLVDVAVTVSPIFGPDGEVTHLSSICRDLSQQRQAERERNQLAALVNSSSDAIVSTDFQGTILSWNAAAEALYGIPFERAIRGSIEVTVPDTHRAELRDLYQKLKAGETIAPFMTSRLAGGGRELEVECQAHTIRDQTGHGRSVAWIVRDVTDLEKHRRRLEETAEALQTRLKDRTAELVELQRQLRRESETRHEIETELESTRSRLARSRKKLAAFQRRTALAFRSSLESVAQLSEKLMDQQQASEPSVALLVSLRRRISRMSAVVDEMLEEAPTEQSARDESGKKSA